MTNLSGKNLEISNIEQKISLFLKNNHVNKGVYAVNSSPMVSTLFYTNAPCDWYGTAATPIVINNGEIILKKFLINGNIFQSINNLVDINTNDTITSAKNIFKISTPIFIPSFSFS